MLNARRRTGRGTLWLAAIGLSLASEASAEVVNGRYWPTVDDWQKSPSFVTHVSDPKCQAFRDYSFNQKNKEIIRTESVLVIKGGYLEYEQYDPLTLNPDFYRGGYKRDTPHVMFSASKSVVSALVGAAVQQSKLTEDDRLVDFFPKAQYRDNVSRDVYEKTRFDKAKANEANYNLITVRDLVEMTAGLDWNEDYGGDPKASSVMRLLYAKGISDMASYAAMQPMTDKAPGKIWSYSSGNMSLAMGVLHKVYGDDAFPNLPWTLLFDRLGFKNAVFERDGVGTFVGSSYVHLRPLDMAKFGYLYLNKGLWRDQQILPADWVEKSHTVVPAYADASTQIADATRDGVYGRTWWLNVDPHKVSTKTGQQVGKPYPHLPDDFYGAFGHYGQYVFIIPSKDLVVVRTAQDRDPDKFNVDYWMTEAMKCFL